MHAFLQATDDARWDDVRLFLALQRGRSLAAAAPRVGLDASTLSRRLAALEESLGTQLFDRTREGLVPTAAAELLLPAAEEMESAHGRFARDASGFEREAEGVVRLSVPPGLADAFLAPALVRLRAKHPRIRLELDASVALLDLTRREADLALRTVRPQSGDLVMAKIGESRWTPMTSVASARERGPVKRWEDVEWVAWGDDLAAIPPARWLARHAPAAAPVLKTSHIATQVAAVRDGLGVALLPLVYRRVAAVAPLRYARALEPSVKDLPINETWLVGHKALRNVPRVAAVWAFVVDEFQHFEDSAAPQRKHDTSRKQTV
jgi:DNA-binding transcriptional LysR family regulator